MAIEYLVGETTLLPRIKYLLKPDVPATTQHAVVGLLRNLSIPDQNKSVLYEGGVIDDLMQMGVWSENRDMLGSVQGGVVGIFKNLCRNQRQSFHAEKFNVLTPNWTQLTSRLPL